MEKNRRELGSGKDMSSHTSEEQRREILSYRRWKHFTGVLYVPILL
jgi:hypothetical protein